MAAGAPRFCPPALPLLLSALGGRATAAKARQVEPEPPPATATRPDCNADERDGKHAPLAASASGPVVKALGALGASGAGGRP